MSFQCSCVFCDSDNVREVIYQNKISVGRKRVLVDGFRKSACENCGEEFYTLGQIDANKELIETTSRDQAGVVFPGLIRSLREDWDLTQREAAKLFGAGAASVGKWESGQTPSGPTALLIQCALHVPGVMQYLAKLAEVEVKPPKPTWAPVLRPTAYKQASQSTAFLPRNNCRKRTSGSFFSLRYADRYNPTTDLEVS